jgi:signal transduction histidine kinase
MQSDSRDRGAEETATAALAQLIATTEEFERRATAAESLAADARTTAAARDERLAHGLHDTALQSLTTAYRFLEAARSSLAASSPETAAVHVDDARAAIQTAIREVREAIEGLRRPEDGR